MAALLENLWDAERAGAMDEADRLVYRSNLLGSDKRITNFGGGNTSSKIEESDPLTGERVEVLWVKGSGGDVGTIRRDGFSTLYMDKLQGLKALYRGPEHEDEMVGYLPHATFDLNPRAASIDTPLHAYVPRRFVDHMHPDAIIALAASEDGERLTREIYGDAIGWLPWRRPGFELGLWLERFCLENPDAVGVILGGHGLFTWGDTPEACYATTIDVINRAIAWFDARDDGPAFGGASAPALTAEARAHVAARLMPRLRGMAFGDAHKIGHFDDSDPVLEFVCSKELRRLAPMGTSCPDHFLRTKIRPLIVDFDPAAPDLDATLERLPAAMEAYRGDYAAYYARCRRPDSPAMRDPNPVVYLVPGVGMITLAKDKATARVSAEFYVNAINVMRGASGVSRYRGLPEQEAFDIEYWLLEEAKLQRMPKPRPLSGRIALITGAAGGIGRATAERLGADGAAVVLTDRDAGALGETDAALAKTLGRDQVFSVVMDVTSEDSVDAAVNAAARAFGGLDILVANAGIVTGNPVVDTALSEWRLNIDVLATGYFLAARAAFRTFAAQSAGGSVIFIASKNALAAGANAAAYSTAKAAEAHLARCLAVEGAPMGVRVNVVNPDAVLRGSRMWDDSRRAERAATYGLAPEELDDHYRQRSLLKRSVYPEDIAEAVAFFAGERAAKSTGNMLNVDAGNAQSFPR